MIRRCYSFFNMNFELYSAIMDFLYWNMGQERFERWVLELERKIRAKNPNLVHVDRWRPPRNPVLQMLQAFPEADADDLRMIVLRSMKDLFRSVWKRSTDPGGMLRVVSVDPKFSEEDFQDFMWDAGWGNTIRNFADEENPDPNSREEAERAVFLLNRGEFDGALRRLSLLEAEVTYRNGIMDEESRKRLRRVNREWADDIRDTFRISIMDVLLPVS